MTITEHISNDELTCFRCKELTILGPTIFPEESYMLVRHEQTKANCCLDCWQRLVEELNTKP